MNKNEIAQLIYIVKANYPKYYKNISETEFLNIVDVWYMCISDYDYNLAQAGLKIYFTSDITGFPPSVGQVIDCIHKISSNQENTMTEMEAWGYVYKAICNSGYNSIQEFERLPDIVQSTVGNPARLKEWSQVNLDEVQTVIQSNFMRSFKAVQNRKKEYSKMPSEVKKMINTELYMLKAKDKPVVQIEVEQRHEVSTDMILEKEEEKSKISQMIEKTRQQLRCGIKKAEKG